MLRLRCKKCRVERLETEDPDDFVQKHSHSVSVISSYREAVRPSIFTKIRDRQIGEYPRMWCDNCEKYRHRSEDPDDFVRRHAHDVESVDSNPRALTV